jgi:Sec-independent protein secretion pathway component TatC
LPIVNAFAHIGAAAAHGAYNAGLFTSVVLFLPLGAYVVRTFVREGLLRPRTRIVAVVASGALLHAVLVGALEAYAHGLLSEAVMCFVQVANGLVPLAVATLVLGRSKTRQPSTA